MWKSLFKQIWNQRLANLWVWTALMIVLIILWYSVDLIYNYEGAANRPKGYDTEDVFDITIVLNPTLQNDSVIMSHWKADMDQIYRLVQQYPGVEQACYYYGSIPFTDDVMFQGYSPHSDSTRVSDCFIRYVSPTYFEVFRLKTVSGTFDADRWLEKEYPMPALMSSSLCDSIFHSTNPIGETCFNPYYIGSKQPMTNYKVMAVLPEHKLGDYERYEPFIYLPASEQMGWWMHIAVRVSPDAIFGFAERFIKEMQPKLAIGPFHLYEVHSYADMKEAYDIQQGTLNYLNSTYAVIAFFLFNIFLSILGTFWFRTRKRQGEIALRMAMGCSPKGVLGYYLSEGLMLLVIAAVPACIICLNVWYADLTIHTLMEPTFGRFVFCFLVSLLLLMVIILLGVCFPALRAMKIQPAEALHDE